MGATANDRRDDASMRLEMEEVAAGEQRVAEMSGELAIALTTAFRMLVSVSDKFEFNATEWSLVEDTVEKLIAARGY